MDIQSANRQHPVPQNVMDVEFKLIGDLTIRQFTYLVVFGVLAMFCAYSGLPNLFKIPLIGFFVIAGISFAFIPLNDITLDKWAVNYIKAILKPRFRVWQHTKNTPYYFNFTAQVTSQNNVSHAMGANNKQKLSLEELLNTDKATSIDFKDDKDLQEKEKEFFNKLGLKHTSESKVNPVINQTSLDDIVNTNKPADEIITKNTINNFVIPNTEKPAERLKKEDIFDEIQTKNSFSNIAITREAQIPTIPSAQNQTPEPIIETPPAQEKNIQFQLPQEQPPLEKKEESQKIDEIKVEPQPTPNTQKNPYEAELLNYQKNIKELNLLKQKLLKELEQNKYKVLEGKEEEVAKITVKERTASLKQENEQLKNKLKKITEQKDINGQKANIEKSPFFASFLLKIKGDKKVDEPTQGNETDTSDEFIGNTVSPADAETIRSKIKSRNQNSKTFKLKGSTNDKDGNIIPDVVIIVKNSAKEAVRALKSNAVGEFESSTDLQLGDYFIEATKDEYTFETLNLKTLDNGKGLVKLIGTKL